MKGAPSCWSPAKELLPHFGGAELGLNSQRRIGQNYGGTHVQIFPEFVHMFGFFGCFCGL